MGKIFTIIGMSGTGKSTLYNKLIELRPYDIIPVIQYTTRPPRENEVDDKDYHFISSDKFDEMIKNGEFVEHRIYRVSDNGEFIKYGTKFEVDLNSTTYSFLMSGTDIQAFRAMRSKFGEDNAIPIFLQASDTNIVKRMFDRCETRSDYKKACVRYLNDIDRYDITKEAEWYNISRKFIINTDRNSAEVVLKVMSIINQYREDKIYEALEKRKPEFKPELRPDILNAPVYIENAAAKNNVLR